MSWLFLIFLVSCFWMKEAGLFWFTLFMLAEARLVLASDEVVDVGFGERKSQEENVCSETQVPSTSPGTLGHGGHPVNAQK